MITHIDSTQGVQRSQGSSAQGSPQLVKAAGVVRVDSSRTEDASCARSGLWEAARRFLMQRLGLGKAAKSSKGAGGGKGQRAAGVHV